MPTQPFPITLPPCRGSLVGRAEVTKGPSHSKPPPQPALLLGRYKETDNSQRPRTAASPRGAAFYFQAFLFPSAVWYYPACSVHSSNKAHVVKNPPCAEPSCLAISKVPIPASEG